ncbi:MAG TPA: NAD-dependent deacetylase [Pseudoclavibacter sp.]|nr:NAD-dependent deacetylase [Pseudoclavibacter sp.]
MITLPRRGHQVHEIDLAQDALRSARRIVVLTGAGVSTESGIPDYRGQGAPRRRPMTLDDFLTLPQARRRYWAGSHLGWNSFARVRPNPSHLALARMQRAGVVARVITQNVDTLHEQAGTADVLHMHGTMMTVSCLNCHSTFPRRDIATQMVRENGPFFARQADLRPDGDAEITPPDDFRVPSCPRCAGMLKPDVVFFGETVSAAVTAACYEAIDSADLLLIAGSSLVVNSGMKLLNRARSRGTTVAIVNRGPTRGDRFAQLRFEGKTSELLPRIASVVGSPMALPGVAE